jgi:hypothetical protein
VIIVPPSEVREKFKRVKPLKDISVKQRGWTLDVLNIVRKIVTERELSQLAAHGRTGGALDNLNADLAGGALRFGTNRAPSEFANEDIYAFTRELEQLHPDNRHVRDNPVKKTGQESASNCKFSGI